MKRHIKQVAVLGSGVMGSAIAAHFANAGIASLLYDLAAEGGDKSATARKAIKALEKQHPEPLARKAFSSRITPCNYDEDLDRLARQGGMMLKADYTMPVNNRILYWEKR